MTRSLTQAHQPPTQPRPIALSLALIFATIAGGLMVRLVPLGLPPVAVKYGGSALWALMIYWIVSTALRHSSVAKAATLALAAATSVELLKLYHRAALDAFRLTLPGALLLGRIFSLWNIVAYTLAIALGALVDQKMRTA